MTSIKLECQMSNRKPLVTLGSTLMIWGLDSSVPSSVVCECLCVRAPMHVCKMMTCSSELLIHLKSSAGLLQREVVLIDRVSEIRGQNNLDMPPLAS